MLVASHVASRADQIGSAALVNPLQPLDRPRLDDLAYDRLIDLETTVGQIFDEHR